jgi:hypothetical protein
VAKRKPKKIVLERINRYLDEIVTGEFSNNKGLPSFCGG